MRIEKRGCVLFRNISLLLMMIAVSGLAAPFAFGSTGSIYYFDGPWKGAVIDSETKEPIEGAVVVTIWEKKYGGPTGPYSYFLDAVEVLTDRDGKFLIPRFWKLNLVPILSWIEGPTFQIFKPGYTAFPGSAYDYFQKYFPASPLRVGEIARERLFKNGVVVELLKLKTREERRMNVPGWIDDVGSEKLPAFYRLVNEENRNLGLEGEVGRKK